MIKYLAQGLSHSRRSLLFPTWFPVLPHPSLMFQRKDPATHPISGAQALPLGRLGLQHWLHTDWPGTLDRPPLRQLPHQQQCDAVPVHWGYG